MIKKLRFTLCTVLCTTFLFSPVFLSVYAASDTFTVQSLVGSDNQPPTTPANFTATPITTSQINLDWDASSDNASVGGYQVFRDSVQIATTTLTSYSDTGLSESTLYTYYITAFDTSFNYATPTASVATSTLTSTPTSTPTTTTQSANTGYRIEDIEIENFLYNTTRGSITISFDTNVYTRAIIRWGRTTDYEGGYIASNAFKREHSTTITGLQPGTVYEIAIDLTDRSLTKTLQYKFSAETLGIPDSQFPPNVMDFTAYLSGVGAQLEWTNPNIEDFSHVRVLSSDYFYPTHPADGYLVYEGTGDSAYDDRPIEDDTPRYYTVFVYDTSGNISSGAVTMVVRRTAQEIPDTATSTASSTAPFSFDDLLFIQNQKEKTSQNGEIELQASRNTTIALPYDLLPEHLKTIVLTLHHPDDYDKVFSFLLRIDPRKETYSAHIGPLVEPGKYKADVEVFDFKTQRLYQVAGVIVVEKSAFDVLFQAEYDSSFFAKFHFTWFLLLLGIIAILLLFLLRKKYKKKMLHQFNS